MSPGLPHVRVSPCAACGSRRVLLAALVAIAAVHMATAQSTVIGIMGELVPLIPGIQHEDTHECTSGPLITHEYTHEHTRDSTHQYKSS